MRSLYILRGVCASALLLTTLSGCLMGPTFLRQDDTSVYEPGSDAWWAEKAALPVGQRQRCDKGKLWPPRPRPTGPNQEFAHMYHAAHYWPYPYICQDRAYVKSVWDMQTSNGWSDETTLYAYHFDPETNELTQPGIMHLNWILDEAPAEYRRVNIQKMQDDTANQARLASVQDFLSTRVVEGEMPAIGWRAGRPLMQPANRVQVIQALDALSIVAPVIGGGGGAGGGGIGAGGGGGAGGSGAGAGAGGGGAGGPGGGAAPL